MRLISSIMAISLLAGILLPMPAQNPPKTPEIKIDKLDEQILHRAKLSTDGDALVAFLKKRILPESDRPTVERLVRQGAGPVDRDHDRRFRPKLRNTIAGSGGD